MDGDISLPSSSLTLGRLHVATLDGVPQNSAVRPETPAQQAREYVVLFDSSFEDLISNGRAGIRWACSSGRIWASPSP